MLREIRTAWLTVIMVGVVGWISAAAPGQHYQPFGDSEINYDFQMFSPPIVQEYGTDGVDPNVGWFIEYNRVYLNLSDPKSSPTFGDGFFQWGNRIDAGYMTPENHGWLVSIHHVNRTNGAELTAVDTLSDPDTTPDFTLVNSTNFGRMAGVELDKTFRIKQRWHERPSRHPTVFEPFIGVRLVEFEQVFQIESLMVDDPNNPMTETFNGSFGQNENLMIGGQLGVRAYTRRGHWIISGEIRVFGMQNFQIVDVNNRVVVTTGGQGGVVQNPVVTNVNENFSEFVPGGELRVEAAYEITREVRVQVGFEWMYFGQGVGRGFDNANLTAAPFTDDSVSYAGVVMGVQVNR